MPVPRIQRGRFSISNSSRVFAPSIYPEVVVSKERNKARTDGLCEGEDVEDTGSKNREFTVTGVIFRSELSAYDEILDDGEEFEMLSDEWVGEIEILDGKYRPYALDKYSFTLNLVSTGKDEYGSRDNGIISSTTDFYPDVEI